MYIYVHVFYAQTDVVSRPRVKLFFHHRFSEQEKHNLRNCLAAVHNYLSCTSCGLLAWRKDDKAAQLQLSNP